MSCLIIAEAGVNHNGDLETAKALVRAAKGAGADVVKFQTYRVEDMIHGDKEMLAEYQLTEEMHYAIVKECADQGIAFVSTPFGIWSVDFLLQFKMPFWKVPSGEMTNLPYLDAIASKGGRVFLSTGMADIDEVQKALDHLNEDVVLLHCSTRYPAPMEDVNLQAMTTLAREFNLPVGYSDHTIGWAIPLAAVAMGAIVIEKHLTLDRNQSGPDHAASMEPNHFVDMVLGIRAIGSAMGSGWKRPTDHELSVRDGIRNRFV